jgi:uncharacterized membrane protein
LIKQSTIDNYQIDNSMVQPRAAAGRMPAVRFDAPDLLRGIVMVVMLLDHTRDFTHADALRFDPTDLTQTSVVLFFTRWITHFCAPLFVLLAGMSAAFQQQRGKSTNELSAFLVKRGLWLCLVELVAIRALMFWMIAPTFFFLQVIWALGISMICLSLLVHLPRAATLALGIAIVVGHNALDGIRVAPWPGPGSPGPSIGGKLWMLLHQPGPFPIAGWPSPVVMAQYPVLAWIGVMAIGWGLGQVYTWPLERRRRTLITVGAAATAAFVLLRATNLYGDPIGWSTQKSAAFTLLSFLNLTKYPPSLLYLLMTIGPGLIALAWFEGVPPDRRSAPGRAFVTFGRVPMLFYFLQWIWAKAAGLLLAAAFGRDTSLYFQTIFEWTWNERVGFPLAVTYAVWISGAIVLYFPCRWFAAVKGRRSDWWLSYL